MAGLCPRRCCLQRASVALGCVMLIVFGLGSPVASAESVISSCPDDSICPEYYSAVCGSDGKTYGNPCFAECNKASVQHAGPCGSEQQQPSGLSPEMGQQPQPSSGTPPPAPKFNCPVCTADFKPVCGADGKTYPNECTAFCNGVEVVSLGQCVAAIEASPPPPKFSCPVCTTEYHPVCGSDGKTYPNECTAFCAGVTETSEGECVAAQDSSPPPISSPSSPAPAVDCGAGCPEIFAPVCGADGWTYSSACDAVCRGNTSVVSQGNCKPCSQDIVCTMEYAPWCGTDGKTYANKCHAACSGVMMSHPGQCEAATASSPPPPKGCPGGCTADWKPVCGADGKTYSNACTAACAQVEVVSQGECRSDAKPSPPPPKFNCPACPDNYAPVCGADDKTYANECDAFCAGVEVAYLGQCVAASPNTCTWCNKTVVSDLPSCAPECGPLFSPVCGADGKTYSSSCHARCAGVRFLSLGVCGACFCSPFDNKEPVCGANGVTYFSRCQAQCLGVSVAKEGACQDGNFVAPACPECNDASVDPVCVIMPEGAREFVNGCAAKCQGVNVAAYPNYKGHCVPKCDYTCSLERLGEARFKEAACCRQGSGYSAYRAEYPNKCYFSCLTGARKAEADDACSVGLCQGEDAAALLRHPCAPGAMIAMCMADACTTAACPGVKDAICVANMCTRYFRGEYLGGDTICHALFIAPGGSDLLRPEDKACQAGGR